MKFATFLGRVNYEIRDFFGLERGYISHMGKKFNYLTPYMADIFYTPPIKKIGLVNLYQIFWITQAWGFVHFDEKKKSLHDLFFIFSHIVCNIFDYTYLSFIAGLYLIWNKSIVNDIKIDKRKYTIVWGKQFALKYLNKLFCCMIMRHIFLKVMCMHSFSLHSWDPVDGRRNLIYLSKNVSTCLN